VSHIRLTILVVSLMVPAVVAHAADGGIQLYLQPLPGEADRLSFEIGTVSAVDATGTEYPLTLNLRSIGAETASRQRLLASGRLPEASYTGFLMTVTRATLKSGKQEAALAVPDQPVRIGLPLTVSRHQAVLVWLTLRYSESVHNGFGFRPGFSAAIPSRPIADHAGFVTNTASNSITVFDKNLSQAVAALDTCAGPAGMALDHPRRRLYVACSRDDEVRAYEVATGSVADRAQMSPGDRPRELALTPDGATLISVNNGSDSVSFFDAVSLIRQERVEVGSGPGSIVVEPAGRRAFVFNTFSSSLSVIDIASRSVVATVSTEAAPLRGVFNRRGDRLFVIHERSPYITVLDAERLIQIMRSRLTVRAAAIVVDPVRELICLGGEAGTIEFYDSQALLPVYSAQARSGASYLAVDVEDNSLYIVSPDTGSVGVVHLATRKRVSEIDVGRDPYWVAVMGGR